MGNVSSSTVPWDPFQKLGSPKQSRSLHLTKTRAGTSTSPSTSSSSISSSPSVSPLRDHSSSGSALSASLTSTNIMGSNAPPLYEHALVGDWNALLFRIRSHPKEACYQDKCKNTPLHVSCRRQPPVEVVDALIRAYPASLTSKTLDGLTPLHFCCYCGSEPPTVERVIQELRLTSRVNKDKDKDEADLSLLRDMVDRRARTPLHYVCAGFRSPHRVQVIRLLLQLDPMCAAAPDERGRTPLTLIVDDYAEELQETLVAQSSQVAQESCLSKGGDLEECWNAMTLLLRAASEPSELSEGRDPFNPETVTKSDLETSATPSESSLLHAAVGVGACPAEFVRLILLVQPDSVRNKDNDRLFPLHIAARTCAWWSTTSTSAACDTDFGRRTSLASMQEGGSPVYDQVIADLVELYSEAAAVPDEFGKVPFILALESGKPWKTCLEPLWNANPEVFRSTSTDALRDIQHILDGALTSVSSALRLETIRTLRHLAPLWPSSQSNEWIKHMVVFSRDCGEFASGTSAEDSWGATIQASTLDGIAAVLTGLPPRHDVVPQTLQSALDLALDLLSYHVEEVRVAASRLVAESVTLLGDRVTDRILLETIFDTPEDCDDTTVSTGDLSSFAGDYEPTVENVHGRIMACHAILHRQHQRQLTQDQTKRVKEWLKHDETIVREASALVAGSLLSTSIDLKEFRSPLLKCMRANGEMEVHLAVARGLAHAAKQHPNLFLCKNGVALLDGALMLSLTATNRVVQQAFYAFLWWALRIGSDNNQDVLQSYLTLAEGGNGRIMMTLVTKTLSKLNLCPSEDEGEIS